MKKLIFLFLATIIFMAVNAQNPTEYFNAGNPIKYCGENFSFVWSAHPQNIYYVQEYLPEGETLEHYNKMFTVSVIFWDRSPLESVQAKVAELEQRKNSDPITNYMVAENNGEYILEFIVSDSNGGKMNTVEVDVHYYRQMEINGRKATVLCFFSERAYGDNITSFIQSIPDKRNSWYEGMSQLNIKPKFPKR